MNDIAIGTTRFGREIDKVPQGSRFVWQACESCGKQRWVRLKGGNPRKSLCLQCGAIKRGKKYGGANHPTWRGGRRMLRGYVYLWTSGHPYATSKGYVFEHRLVMEKALGRYLERDEIVHHLNGIRDDNRIKNLALLRRTYHGTHTLTKVLKQRIRELEAELSQQRMAIK